MQPVDQSVPADEGAQVPGQTEGDMDQMDQSSANDQTAEKPAELQSLLAERDKYLELAQRTRAEFENYQKRISRDLEQERKYAVLPFVSDLLPVIDNLDRALQSANNQNEGIIAGVQLVRKQLLDILARHGVEPIQPAEDQPFDPNLHQALMQQPTAEKPPLTILQTLQAGYKMHERVVRPAQVVVSTAPADGTSETVATDKNS